MDLFKNFIGNIVQSMPHVSKVAYVSTQIKKYLSELNEVENERFSEKFTIILEKFVEQKITLTQMCMIVEALDGVSLSKSQINYFCNQVYLNGYLIEILQKYIDCNHINDEEIHYVAEFLVVEINKAIING
ncbi:ac75 [Hemileuca sp. nucleopolyhedrovirus]|uniref:Ac75 n=1 Tax=Hemileuca sp. nucleopolyhedrovirus TaxID=1367203 RepID=S5N379_9ABAC|nr:ac75 [Hemileuca sp. nucleopolyhedrovirus]AGR56820.1 ac75 [Hemileuca sp. nucleopolyhedrovirus]